MDYSLLRTEILVAMRGSQSQIDMSRRLGYSYNQMHKWESGTKRIKWTDFDDLCAVLGIDLSSAFRSSFQVGELDTSDPGKVFETLHNMVPTYSLADLAKYLHSHISVIRRWAKGESNPDLEMVLRLIDLRPNILSTFLSKIVDVNRVPSLKSIYDTEAKLREFESLFPYACTIELCVGLEDYKKLEVHSNEFIAERVGLPVDTVRKTIGLLVAQGRLVLKSGKYVPDFKPINMHGDLAAISRVNKYWIERSLSRFNTLDGIPLNSKKRPNTQTFYVASMSKESMKKISTIIAKCHEEIMQTVVDDKMPEEEIRIILLHHFSPDDAPFEVNPSVANVRPSLSYEPQL